MADDQAKQPGQQQFLWQVKFTYPDGTYQWVNFGSDSNYDKILSNHWKLGATAELFELHPVSDGVKKASTAEGSWV
jgi:hypothetical protein